MDEWDEADEAPADVALTGAALVLLAVEAARKRSRR